MKTNGYNISVLQDEKTSVDSLHNNLLNTSEDYKFYITCISLDLKIKPIYRVQTIILLHENDFEEE